MDPQATLDSIRADLSRVREEFAKRIVGNEDVLEFILKALLNGGHILMEGLPGLGKTLMVKTVAEILELKFSRVQFTPDLMPADILGTNLIVEDQRGHRQFQFEKGPVFTNILLADEINRASPKTQSALLQSMEEREATLFGRCYRLDPVFFVLATQNPIEMAGTYPLPEAQLDRFVFKLVIGFPPREQLREIAERNACAEAERPSPARVLDCDRVLAMRDFMCRIPVSDRIFGLATDLVHSTHPEVGNPPEVTRKYIRYGASPRGLNAILGASRVSAALDGRFNVSVDDVEQNYLACLRHRILLNFEGEIAEVGPDRVLREIFAVVRKRH